MFARLGFVASGLIREVLLEVFQTSAADGPPKVHLSSQAESAPAGAAKKDRALLKLRDELNDSGIVFGLYNELVKQLGSDRTENAI